MIENSIDVVETKENAKHSLELAAGPTLFTVIENSIDVVEAKENAKHSLELAAGPTPFYRYFRTANMQSSVCTIWLTISPHRYP